MNFHEVVRDETLWQKKLNISDEFIEQYLQTSTMQNDYKITDDISTLANALHVELKVLPIMDCYFQHGDFCINNLLFDEHVAHIIDWDEFGEMCMPLQDEFSLALSFFHIGEHSGFEQLRAELQVCMTNSQWLSVLTKQAVVAMFLYHLFYRLGLWGSNPRRKGVCDWLYTVLIEFSANPNLLFDWLDVQKN
jgi:hypothetical protein